jgi:hypothetical protein
MENNNDFERAIDADREFEDMEVESTGYVSILRIDSPSERLAPRACCPDAEA